MSRGVWNIPGIISTHDLTKRSTIDLIPKYLIVKISTHDLTKRSTVEKLMED